MNMPTKLIACVVGVWGCLVFPVRVNGQQEAAPPDTPAQAEPPPESPPAPLENLPGPKYNLLRFEDDFSYLDGEEGSYKPDFFDPIKNVTPNEDWRISFGGEVQLRLMSETNTRNFGAIEPAQDTFFLHQVRLHADVKYRKLFRFFFEGINAMVEDRDFPALAIDENRFDFHQVFADFNVLGEEVPLTLRFGRQEMAYGKQRLISPLPWGNTRRRFDGVKLFWRDDNFDLDAWYVKALPINRAEGLHRKPDEYNADHDFYGLYGTYKGIKNHGIDTYFLAQDRTDDTVNANGRAGDLSLYMLGMRFWGKTGPWDYEAEWGGQWGKYAGQTIQAWMFTGDGGFTFKDVPWQPRLGVGFDYASGDEDPNDGVHQTFNQFFPLGHAHLGYLDLVGRQNIYDARTSVTIQPIDRLTADVAYHALWLAEPEDALYNAGGGVTRRAAVGGRSSRELGHELDLTVSYALDVHSAVLLGWSHFWGDNFLEATGRSEDADLLYLQYVFKF